MEPEASWNSCEGDHLTDKHEDVCDLSSCVIEPLRKSARNTGFAVVATKNENKSYTTGTLNTYVNW